MKIINTMRSKLNKTTAAVVAAPAAAVVLMANNALATTFIDDVFAAVDVSTLGTKIVAVLVSFIGIALAFTGYRYARRAMSS